MEFYTLNNGKQMPKIGMGCNTFGKEGHDYYAPLNHDTTELRTAIEAGYRHFDTAISYRNESVIGKAVKESGLSREDFFLTSKLPGEPEFMKDEATIHEHVAKSLENLGGYIDLYLIHHPWDDLNDMVRVWKVLETYVDKGLIGSLGVSNFSAEQMDAIIEGGNIRPTVNQIKIKPGHWNHELIKECLDRDIYPVAWSPLNRLDEAVKTEIEAIAKRVSRTWAQVILHVMIRENIAVIPKSHNAQRQKENLDIFDFELDKNDLEKILSL